MVKNMPKREIDEVESTLDFEDAESDWSDPLRISMPKNKPFINTPFLSFLEHHPQMFPMLRQLLGL